MGIESENGFTLIELVLAIIIVAILGSVVSLGLSGLSSARLNQAENKVIGDLRYAQQLAISTRTRHGLTIAAGGSGYSVHIDGGVAPFLCGGEKCIPDPINLGRDFIVDFNTYQQGQLAGVQFNSLTPFCPAGCGACEATLEFNSRGAPTNTSGTEWACDVTVVLSKSGTANQTITITANTGKVSG